MGGMMCLKHLSGARYDMLFKPGCDGKMHTGLLRDHPFDEANLRN